MSNCRCTVVTPLLSPSALVLPKAKRRGSPHPLCATPFWSGKNLSLSCFAVSFPRVKDGGATSTPALQAPAIYLFFCFFSFFLSPVLCCRGRPPFFLSCLVARGLGSPGPRAYPTTARNPAVFVAPLGDEGTSVPPIEACEPLPPKTPLFFLLLPSGSRGRSSPPAIGPPHVYGAFGGTVHVPRKIPRTNTLIMRGLLNPPANWPPTFFGALGRM